MLIFFQTFCYVFMNLSAKNTARIKMSKFVTVCCQEAVKSTKNKVETVSPDTLQHWHSIGFSLVLSFSFMLRKKPFLYGPFPPFIVLSYDFVRNHQYFHLLVQKYLSQGYGSRKCCNMLILCHLVHEKNSVRHSLSHTVNFIITQTIHPTRKLLLQNIYPLVQFSSQSKPYLHSGFIP